MQLFLLPYILSSNPAQRLFVKVVADTISAAAAKAEEQIRKAYWREFHKTVIVGVAEVDYTWRNRATGRPIPQPAPRTYRPRRRRNQGGVFV